MSSAPYSSFSTSHLDYLQRNQLAPGEAVDSQTLADQISLWHIEGMARPPKKPNGADERLNAVSARDILSGLYGSRMPLVFMLTGTPKGVTVLMGTWRAKDDRTRRSSAEDNNVLRSLLESLHPAIKLSASDLRLKASPASGFVMGIPSPPTEAQQDASAIDRLTRAMSGTNWAAMVIAEPVSEVGCRDLRDMLTNEIRATMAAAQDSHEPSPLANQYIEQLTALLQSYSAGLSGGMWRTGVYLLGSATTFPKLAGVWRGVFGGEKSIPETVRVIASQSAGSWAEHFVLPDDKGETSPGLFAYPFRYQTVLNSSQLACYIQLPSTETCGFAMQVNANFDIVPPHVTGDRNFSLGTVIERDAPTSATYQVSANALTRHMFVAGVTGAGKTNTIFAVLKEAARTGVPFLVVEPAKTEYRALIDDPQFTNSLRIFTLGNERISPLRLNPFEVLQSPAEEDDEPFWPVALHLDLLRSVFNVSFGMWNPLPQVLERCLYSIYEDRGWNIASGRNRRFRAGDTAAPSAAFPTLSDLFGKVDEVTLSLGYEDRVASDIRAALKTRINALRTGGKGRMLDVQQSTSIEALLDTQAVVELEDLGDDDDKAFVMGLIFIRLIELRRTQGQHAALRHLMVIEEAHRLLTNVSAERSQEDGNPRAKAVETFTGLLSEVRSYGQGIIIADQVPVRLAPDVMKNSNLKIAHRIVARDDRDAMAGAMVMSGDQAEALARLTPGRAALFSDGDDGPVLVKIPDVKSQLGDSWPANGRVAQHMRAMPALGVQPSGVPFAQCATHCRLGPSACTAAQAIVDDPLFQRAFNRLVLSAIEDPEAVSVMMQGEVWSVARSLRPTYAELDEQHLLQCVKTRAADVFSQRRGAQAGWSYSDTAAFSDALRAVIGEGDVSSQSDVWRAFRDRALALHERQFDPFPACSRVCPVAADGRAFCLYRAAVNDVVRQKRYDTTWSKAGDVDSNAWKEDPSLAGRARERWNVCQEAGSKVIRWPEAGNSVESIKAARSTARCFAQQMLAREEISLFTRETHFVRIYMEGEKQYE